MATSNHHHHLECIWFLCVCIYSLVYANADDAVCKKTDPGTISSCFSPVRGKTQLEINWTPQNLTGNHTYEFTLVKLMAPKMNFENGSVHLTVWIPGLPHEKPLYNKTTKFSCHDIIKNLPSAIQPFVKCPFKGDWHISTPMGPLRFPLPQEIPVPKGSYHVRAEVYESEDPDLTKDPLVCIDGWLIFADVEPRNAGCSNNTQDSEPATGQFNIVQNPYDNEHVVDKL